MGDAPTLPPTKLSRVHECMAAGDMIGALRIAARFPRLGDHRDAITKAWAAHTRPDFYREIGQDPDALIAAGIDALRERYG